MTTLSAPIPFVTLSDEDGAFEVSADAAAYLSRIRGPVAVVSIAGLYRTGKSYLLNLLLGRDCAEAMFNVGATVNACTKGIWIWGEPVAATTGEAFKHLPADTTVLFMDTEGLGSTQRSQTQDTRIFALTVLLSSLFIYNSRGVIDSNAIEDLSLVVNLTKYIQTKASTHLALDDSEDESNARATALASYFPDFLWIVRDFTLQLEEDGQQVSARDYFESALKQQPPLTDEVVQKNHIRSLLSTFFPVRDCLTMVRPLNDENLLRDLVNQPYESLRPEFRRQMEALRKKIAATLKPKKIMTKALSGPMLVTLAENYVAAFNSGGTPVISSAWDRVMESQCDQALEAAKQMFSKTVEAAVTEKSSPIMMNGSLRTRPLGDNELTNIHAQAHKLAEQELMHGDSPVTGPDIEIYLMRLSEYSLEILQKQYVANDELSTAFNKALLEEILKRVSEDSDDPAHSQGALVKTADVDQLRDRLTVYKSRLETICSAYDQQALGSQQTSVLCSFLANSLTDGILEWGTAVRQVFREKSVQLEGDISVRQQELRAMEGKARAALEMLAQHKESYERTLQTLSERITEERSTLREEIRNKQAEIERTRLQVERVSALHKETLERLEAQVDEAKAERRRLEASAQETAERHESERKEAKRQLLERERSFHEQEKDLLQGQQEQLQQVVELEQQIGDQDAEHMRELFELERKNRRELADLTLKHEDEQEELKEKTILEIRELKNEHDEDLASLQSDIEDKVALLSALREQLATREALEAARKAKASQLFPSADDCVVQ